MTPRKMQRSHAGIAMEKHAVATMEKTLRWLVKIANEQLLYERDHRRRSRIHRDGPYNQEVRVKLIRDIEVDERDRAAGVTNRRRYCAGTIVKAYRERRESCAEWNIKGCYWTKLDFNDGVEITRDGFIDRNIWAARFTAHLLARLRFNRGLTEYQVRGMAASALEKDSSLGERSFYNLHRSEPEEGAEAFIKFFFTYVEVLPGGKARFKPEPSPCTI